MEVRPLRANGSPWLPWHDRFLPLWRFQVPMDFSADRKQEVMIFTDRPVYQPGETLHVEIIARERDGATWTLPAGLKGHFELRNPRGETFLKKEFTLSRLGSYSEAVVMPDVLGSCQGNLWLDNDPHNSHWFSWRVEQYKPNSFEVKLNAKPSYVAGETPVVQVEAKYLFGKSLSKAKMHWSLRTRDIPFDEPELDGFVFGSSDAGSESEEGSAFQQGQANLDEGGKAGLALNMAFAPGKPQPRSGNLLVEITDLNQQTISERAEFTQESSDFYLGLKSFPDVLTTGQKAPVILVAFNADHSSHDGPVQASVVLKKIKWNVVRQEGAGGALTYKSEQELTKVSELQATTIPVHKEGAHWALNSEDASAFNLLEAGDYIIEAEARDAGGRPVRASTRFSVAASAKKERTTWPYPNEAQIDLMPDKHSYLPGESATILVKTPISGKALVTVERDTVYRSFIADLAGNAPSIQIPLGTVDAPNVFVSVLLVRGSEESARKIKAPEYRLGYCQLNVERRELKLAVRVEPDSPSYRPGQTVSVTAEAKDGTGAAAVDAEVILYAVDEGVLSLMGYKTPDPFAEFEGARPLRLQTGLSLPSLLPEDPEQLTFSNKGYVIGGGGYGDEESHPRHNFLACAFWNSSLRTNSDGKVTASFVAPDSITRYRLIAVAHTATSQFGSGDSSFEVKKPLILEPALPRFGNIGDHSILRAVLHNTTDNEGEAELSVNLDEKAAVETSSSDRALYKSSVHLPAHGSIEMDFPVEFQNAGEARWLWKASLSNPADPAQPFSDSIQTTLNVGYAAPLLHEVLIARSNEADRNLLADANPQFLEGTGEFTATVANTRLSQLNEAVRYLMRYPYGCVEQTASTMLPRILSGELGNSVPELRIPRQDADAAIASGVRRLISMQTPSGGLSFWPGGNQPMLWGSAYGGMALALARQHGRAIPVAILDKLCGYLGRQLRDTAAKRDNYELADRCLAVYTLALAGRAEPAYHELLFQKRTLLSAESRALVALAILESHGSRDMVDELLNPRERLPAQADAFFGSGQRELAIELLAWTAFDPKNAAVDTLAVELLAARDKHGHWTTTQGNAWALLALAKYAKDVEGAPQPAQCSLTYGTRTNNFALKDNIHTHVQQEKINTSLPALDLKNPRKALLFTQVRLEARPRVALQPRQDRGYGIARNYSKLNDDGSLSEAKDLQVGDRVLVTLKIEVRAPAHYLAIADPLPSILEATNPAFKSQATDAGDSMMSDWQTDFRELREDRALFFTDHAGPGSYTIRYLARVRAAGSAVAPAALIEEMYHPERFGMTETIEMRSKPLK